MFKAENNLWGITTFFNPGGYKNKYSNYKIFRENSKRQGLKLLAVELAFDDSPFELKEEDAEKIIQIRGGKKNILWQKEALLNIALKNLPEECTKFAWIDSDIIFADDDWIVKIFSLLDEYKIVQAFSRVAFLKKHKSNSRIDIKNIKPEDLLVSDKFGFAYAKDKNVEGNGRHPGFVWAARRDILDKIGFYDKDIVGNNDTIMAQSFYSLTTLEEKWSCSERLMQDINRWRKKCFSVVEGNVFYCDLDIYHLWHGKKINRFYEERSIILEKHKFDPSKDIGKNKDGILEWSTDKEMLVKEVEGYFYSRKEEGRFSFKGAYFNFIYRFKYGGKGVLLVVVGKIGALIKKISPILYNCLVDKKPKWLE